MVPSPGKIPLALSAATRVASPALTVAAVAFPSRMTAVIRLTFQLEVMKLIYRYSIAASDSAVHRCFANDARGKIR